MTLQRTLLFTAALGILCGSAWAADEPLPDAASVVRTVASPTTKPAESMSVLAARIKEFRANAGAMPAARAATQWLDLMDQAITAPDSQQSRIGTEQKSNVEQAFAALPPPAAWEALVKDTTRRSAQAGAHQLRWVALRLLAHELTADDAATATDLRQLHDGVQKSRFGQTGLGLDKQLAQAVLQQTNEPDLAAAMFEQQLKESSDFGGQSDVNVPDLVTLVGSQKATELLRQALKSKIGQLNISEAKATAALARKLAIGMVDQLNGPQWGLVNSAGPDSVALYEAMEKRFSEPTTQKSTHSSWIGRLFSGGRSQTTMLDYQKQRATEFYLAGLIAQGRTEDATALAIRIGQKEQTEGFEALGSLAHSGRAREVFDFFDGLLTRQPQLPYWGTYIQLAGQVGQTAQALKNVRAALAKPDLPKTVRETLNQQLITALLADDHVDEAVALLRKSIALMSAARTTTQPISSDAPGIVINSIGQDGPAIQLARLGLVLHKADLLNEGIKAALETCHNRQLHPEYDFRSYVALTAGLLHLAHRDAEAVKLLAQDIARPKGDQEWSNMKQDELAALLSIYHQAGRHADVLELLRSLPEFEGDHLSDILTNSDSAMRPFYKSGQLYIGYMAASAQLATGNKEAARNTVHALLQQEWGYDPAYALLVDMDGDQAIPLLDGMYARDHYEERPLIWKAQLLLRSHKLADAQKTIRQAISIDPSDGEEPRGDRMRAYSVLADILAQAGDAEQAGFYRGAVAAIRMSEDADQLIDAGLLKRGIELYKQSLKRFADAYCIQSRLAVQLSQIGDSKGAQAHYQRAFELMPESFGEVESHCFGCERVFDGKQAQSIAERVFSKLLTTEPKKPQVHYLLGYLRYEQAQYTAALPLFRQAVQLDPDYLNAWSKIDELGRYVRLPAKDRDDTTFAMMRLDPLSHHVTPDLGQVTDLKRLWSISEILAKKFPPPTPDPLMELTASRAHRAAHAAAADGRTRFTYTSRTEPVIGKPAQAVAQQQVVSAVLQFLNDLKNF
jgi:tetratricopeptide (TPR) repeat protein